MGRSRSKPNSLAGEGCSLRRHRGVGLLQTARLRRAVVGRTFVMHPAESLTYALDLARPERGASVRVQLGTQELVLEAVRGGHSLLWLDGRSSRRFVLGLPRHGDLRLELRAPRLPVHVATREVLAVAPGGRLRGYLLVPLVPTIVVRRGSEALALVEVAPQELAAEWDDAQGARFATTSPFLTRFPMRSGEPKAVVPLVLRNDSDRACSPEHLPVTCTCRDLVPLRGCLVVAPRRLVWNGATWKPLVHPAEVRT